MEICFSCGTIAPEQSKTCSRCNNTLQGNRGKPGQMPKGLNWARFDGHFLCRSCGFDIQINYLDTDGAILCTQCGIDQRFNWERWEGLLVHAHNVADLCGRAAPGNDTPIWEVMKNFEGDNLRDIYGKVGKSHSLVSLSEAELFEGFKYEFNASPGHPVCKKCNVPLDVKNMQGGLTVSCPDCEEIQTYTLPQKASQYESLKGVVAPEHQSGLEMARQERQDGSGAIALTCPKCAGNIDQAAKEGFATCPYCGTSLFVPSSLLKSNSTQQPPRPWWLLFEGPSVLRNKLEKQVRRVKKRKEETNKRQAGKKNIQTEVKSKKAGGFWGFVASAFGKHPVIFILSLIVGINVLFFIPKVLGLLFGGAMLLLPIYLGLFKKWKSRDAFSTTALGIRFGIYLWCGLMFAAVGTIGIPQAVTYTARITAPLVCPEGYRDHVEAKIVTTKGNTSEGYTVSTSMHPICVGAMGKTNANQILVLALLTGFYMIYTLPWLLIEYIRTAIRLRKKKAA